MYFNEIKKCILDGEYKILNIDNDDQVYFSSIQNYSNGLKNGVFKYFDRSGVLTTTQTYENDILIDEKQNINSENYIDYVNDISSMLNKDGKYIIHKDEQVRVCKYVNNKLNGQVYTYVKNKDTLLLTSVENFLNDMLYDEQTYYNAFLEPILIEYFEKGNSIPKRATFFEYYPGTKTLKSVVNFINKKREGYSANYYPNGKLKQKLNYKYGLLDGIVKNYDEDGNVDVEKYEFGSKVSLNTIDVL